MILYVKAGCPWCRMAEDYLDKHGYKYKQVDVRRDPVAFERTETHLRPDLCADAGHWRSGSARFRT